MRIWREIPTGPTINRSLSDKAQRDGDVIKIIAAVNRYQAIQKILYDNLLPRRTHLAEIVTRVTQRLEPSRMSAAASRIGFNISHLNETDRLVLAQLGRRARAKLSYLGMLIEHYTNHVDELTNPGRLWEQMNAPQPTNGKLIGITPGNLIERADPLHRSFDMSVTAEGGIQPSLNMHSVLAHGWLLQVLAGTTSVPLWLYLENTVFCTDSDAAKACHVVSYQNVGQHGADVFGITHNPSDAMLLQAKMGGNYNWEPFDTQWVTRSLSAKSGPEHALAYVWTEKKELFAGLHNPEFKENGERTTSTAFHHSSFTSGGMVLCAGMIAAAGGKITYLSNDSGHYQPDSDHLKKIARHLNKRFLFSPEARIHDASVRNSSYTVAEFLPPVPVQGRRARSNAFSAAI